MAVDHGDSSAAAAAAADEVVAEEAGTDSGANNTKQDRTGDGPAPSESGRVPTKRKPKIDIDTEIEEANRLAALFRKMQNASKVAARNAARSKQRLMRKANQLSEQDLMRLAVLKRCGIFAPEDDDTVAPPMPLEATSPVVKRSKAQEHISCRFKTLVSSVPGAADVLEGLDKCTAPVAAPLSGASKSSSSMLLSGSLPKAVGLKRLPSRATASGTTRKGKANASVTASDAGANDGASMEFAGEDEE
jgi:hypothetical protein